MMLLSLTVTLNISFSSVFSSVYILYQNIIDKQCVYVVLYPAVYQYHKLPHFVPVLGHAISLRPQSF